MRRNHGFSGKGRCDFCYGNLSYKGLWPHEYLAINAYMECKDSSRLAEIIKQNWVESQSMREAIADIVSGKLKRPPRKKASTAGRDIDICTHIADLLCPYTGHKNLTSNREDGAAAIVAEKYGVSEDVALKAWERYKHLFPAVS